MAILNKRELAEILECDRSTLTTWQKIGLPIAVDGTKGLENKYNTREVIDWMIKREVNKAIGEVANSDGEFLDSDQELARLRHHQANKTKIEEDMLKGKVLDAGEVQLAMAKLDVEIRSAVLALPSRMAPKLIQMKNVREIRAALKADVLCLLEAISDGDEQDALQTVDDPQ